MLFWALLVFSLRFALPNGRWGRNGNWTVWLVAVAVSPGPSARSPIGGTGSPLPVSPPIPEASAAVPLRPDGGGPGSFAGGMRGGCRSRLVGIPSPPILRIDRGLTETRPGSGRSPPPHPVSGRCVRRPVPKSSLAVLFRSPVPWRIAAVPPALGFP